MLPPRRFTFGLARRWWRCEQSRAFVDARVKWVRDRALDHAVEKEKHLFPLHALKDLLLLSSTSPSAPSLPLSFIAERREELRLPFRAIRFIRMFPSAFLEEHPPSSSSSSAASAAPPRPQIRPSPELLRLHADEQRTHDSCRADAADRLLRLLMLVPRRRLPLRVVDRLRWDIGLPPDYARSLLPEYPDYFQIVPGAAGVDLDLELVCYSKDLAVSAMERHATRTGGYKKGMPLAFPLQFPRGFDLEKKVKKWVDEWQKLPYISPYENGSCLPPKSDILEKWTVGVLHELLHLLISKKTEKDNLVLLGEHVGLPPGFRKAITHHPGIFYISNKLRTQTIVLREAYKRDLLVEKHPLVGLRYQYIHLMHKGNGTHGTSKDPKSKRVAPVYDRNDEEEVEEDEDEEDDDDGDDDGQYDEDVEVSGEIEDEESDDDIEALEVGSNAACETARPTEVKNAMSRMPSFVRRSPIESLLRTSKVRVNFSRRTEARQEACVGMKSRGRANYSKYDKKLSPKRSAST